ncbi:hypothetical protein C0995_005277 [Termitomyces sp. Mi166|nr:hypothetical protein C0995_005277 [Termitomyces sp. Mi166\
MAKATIELINNAATALIVTLRRLGYTCALCGDLACYGFGVSRVPKRVEAIIFAPSEQRVWPPTETLISQVIQEKHMGKGRFYVQNGTPDVLLYLDHTMGGKAKKICVADISYLDSPAVHLIQDADDLPFMPISYIILQKLEKWAMPFEKSSKGSRKQAERAADVILELLKVANTIDNLDMEPLYPPLWDASRQRILRFMIQYSSSASAWKKLGFGSDSPVAKSLSFPSNMQPSEPLRSPEVPSKPEGSEIPPIADPTSTQMAIMAANDSVRLLSKCGWHSAIFGSLACFLYGNNRAPNDVDILVLPPSASTVTTEDLKQNLVVLDPCHFFLESSKDPHDAHGTLWYRLTNDPARTTTAACKVDLLLPGVMNLPNLPPSLFHWDEGLPLVPFSLLLLQKLQAWDDHRRSRDPIKWQRQRIDMEDVNGLTGLSAFVPLKFSRPWSDTTLFSPEFQELTKERVIDYCTSFPSSVSAWKSLGFEI